MSSGVVHQNIDVRKRKKIFGLPCLGSFDSRNQLSEGKPFSKSVTIQLNLVTLRVVMGARPLSTIMEPGRKQVNVTPPSISRCV